jgi:subtilisin family serine protease/N-acetylneuraminic acid mutarotase
MQHSRGGPSGSPGVRGGPSPLRRMFIAGAVLMMGVMTAATVASPANAAPSGADKIEKDVTDALAKSGSAKVFVYLNAKADLSGAAKQPGKAAQGQYVMDRLAATASESQRGLAESLTAGGAKFQQYWIANAMVVEADRALIDSIAARSDVKSIELVGTRYLIQPTARTEGDASPLATEWGLQNIQAPRVWNELGVRGEGVVVGSVDSGAQFDHPALVNKYRGNLGNGTFDHNYNFGDPVHRCGNPFTAPCDFNGHGTHTMGTMVGDDGAGNQVGVAPGAKWITALGCESFTAQGDCSEEALLGSGQWLLAPTDLTGANPRPDLRPDVVNNSWGGGGNDPWYNATIDAWKAAGMVPIFSAGNSGPACGSVGSPGQQPGVYAVGAYDVNNTIASFSSRGPAASGEVKPNISGPGVSVRSSIPGNGYANFNGTSMAAPHISGVVALLISAAPGLRGNLDSIFQLLNDTATDTPNTQCGGTDDFNNVFGEGRVNAFAAVNAAPRGDTGKVQGTVTNSATGAPIAGATVSSGAVSVTTSASGAYSLTLPAGDNTVTVTAFGFATETATVSLPAGGIATLNFALDPQATVTLSGAVKDGSGHGWPLYAKIEVAGRPGAPIYTNPFTGAYSLSVPANTTYTLKVTPVYTGYQVKTETVVVGGSNLTHDISVPVTADCTAKGYELQLPALATETFDGTTAPAGWSVVNRGALGWQFNDPKATGNLTGGTGGFADADSDAAGSGTTFDSDLISPTYDLSSAAAPVLRFNSDFRDLGDEDFADISLSTDGGTTWTRVYHETASKRGPRVEELALAGAANKSAVKLKFSYGGTYDWWWQVDNVSIVQRFCTPVAGGLVAGFTKDFNTGAGLNGVTVTSVDKPTEKTTSVATPDDPNIGDGFYWLYSSLTGDHPFTASKNPYAAETKTVPVGADTTTQADFSLRSAKLSVGPTSIEAYVTLGQTRKASVTVTNSGSAPTEVEVVERGGTYTALGRPGVARNDVAISSDASKAAAKMATPANSKVRGTTAFGQTAVDAAWSNIASAPTTLFDNAVVNIDGKLYSVGGSGVPAGSEKQLFIYDIATNTWTAGPAAPTAHAKGAAAAIDGKVYAIGGWTNSGAPNPAVDVYDPATNAWTTLAAQNPAPRSAAGVAVVDGKVYLVGGCTDGDCTPSSNTVQFDPAAGTFAQMAPYPTVISWMSCGGIGSQAYCAGGYTGLESPKAGYAFNPGANSWSPIANMPADQWAAADAVSGGKLIISSGIASNGTVVTNQTVAYDPVADSWATLPNANQTRYRAAGACGFYKVGGRNSSNGATAEAEHLNDVGDCSAGDGDVPWLSERPATFTLAPGASQVVQVTLSATPEAGVDQPGDYTAQLGFRAQQTGAAPTVDVTMHVLPPNNYGKVTGKVTGLQCSGSTVGVPAQLEFTLVGDSGTSYSIKAKADGTYQLWLPRGRYDLIVSKDGWVAQVKRVQVQPGLVLTQDFALKPFGGCNTRAGGV